MYILLTLSEFFNHFILLWFSITVFLFATSLYLYISRFFTLSRLSFSNLFLSPPPFLFYFLFYMISILPITLFQKRLF